MTKFDIAANIAFFLLETKGSVLATWKGKMAAKQQRELFGTFFGKGEININGAKETIAHTVSRCFGCDYEITFAATFATIDASNDDRFNAYYKVA